MVKYYQVHVKLQTMIIYNVTVKVEKEIAKEWVAWMKQEHIPELMQTGLFIDTGFAVCWSRMNEGKTYTAQYFCDSLEHYHTYITEHASKMREKGLSGSGIDSSPSGQ